MDWAGLVSVAGNEEGGRKGGLVGVGFGNVMGRKNGWFFLV